MLLQLGRALALIAACVSTLLLPGCIEGSNSSVGNAATKQSLGSGSRNGGTIQWNCGVVLPGEFTTVTFPVEIPGIVSIADIIEIRSSCDCTQVKLRETPDGLEKAALLAQIRIDRSDEQVVGLANDLNVVISLLTKHGECHEAIVRVMFL